MTPYEMQNLVYGWVYFLKLSQIWAKIGSDLWKFWKNWGFCSKFGPKLGLLHWYFAARPYQNQTWGPPPYAAVSVHCLCYTEHKTGNEWFVYLPLPKMLAPINHFIHFCLPLLKLLFLLRYIFCKNWVLLKSMKVIVHISRIKGFYSYLWTILINKYW